MESKWRQGTDHQGIRSLDLEGPWRTTRQPLALQDWRSLGPEGLGLAEGRGAGLGSALEMKGGFRLGETKSQSPPSILKYRTLAARSLRAR